MEQFERHGFNVVYEDSGARRTGFDDFDTIERFRRVTGVRNALIGRCGVSESGADDLIHSLEEVHPRLFDALAAAFTCWMNAQTEEDMAQAACSGRRFLKLATDTWFPGQETIRRDRKVTDHEVKNRFWAYLEEAVGDDTPESDDPVRELGSEFDKLWDRSSKLLHQAHPKSDEVADLLIGIVHLTARTISLNPSRAANPFRPYEGRLIEILKSSADDEKNS
jgi:hypothetical protein